MDDVPEANCAICGAPPFPECPHEGESLNLALVQAYERWKGYEDMRLFVLNKSRDEIIARYNDLRSRSVQRHQRDLEANVPFYNLYRQYGGKPQLEAAQTEEVAAAIAEAGRSLQNQVDQEWQSSLMLYPEVLDKHFSSIEVSMPKDSDPRIQWATGEKPRRLQSSPTKPHAQASENTSVEDVAPTKIEGDAPTAPPLPWPYESGMGESMSGAQSTAMLGNSVAPVGKSTTHEKMVLSGRRVRVRSSRERLLPFTNTMSRDETGGDLATERKLLSRLRQNKAGSTPSRSPAPND
ncbi:hypothetical protein CBER1_08262 [Cercospora berteroae]|uniref:Uncharacterized protein n=1 Tax=Cercospora berteroae TaxID=357750 RepID=A0A2S6CEV1_9PEZI|nr:hypothetical protein CBER1_08262 [Cercospora berteroae]